MTMKKYFILWASIMFIVLAACGNAPAQSTEPVPQEQKISVEEYKKMVSELNTKIMDESLLLANVGMYEYNYWKAYNDITNTVPGGNMDYDVMVEKAMEWLSKNSDANADTVKSTYDDLIAAYADIADANVDGEISEDISTLSDALFGAYYQLYIAVTEPSGTIQDFLVVLNDSANAVMTFNEDLCTALNN